MKVDVSGLLRQVVPECETDNAFEAALSDKCAQRFGDRADSVYEAIMRIIDGCAEHAGESRLEAARQIARSRATLDRQTQTMKAVDLNDAPTEIRQKVQQMMDEGKTSMSTSRTFRYDSATDGPPPPEILEAARQSLADADSASIITSGPHREGSWLKWVLLAVLLLVILGIVFLLMNRGSASREAAADSLPEVSVICSTAFATEMPQ